MLYYDRISISEEIFVNNTTASKECDICHYCYFLNKEFTFQQFVCNGCHGVIMMSMNLSSIAFLNISGADYCYIINGISKSESLNLLQKTDLKNKKWNIRKYNFYWSW